MGSSPIGTLPYIREVPAPPPLRNISGIDDALERAERALRGAVESDDAFLTEVASHLIGAGGKRVRPALAITAASVGNGEAHASDTVIQGAVSVELVHLGSLYHDDVMDEAATRRSVESVNARWGNLVAILAGDFLLARASELASELGTEVAGLLAATIGRLCEGQVAELQRAFDVTRDEATYTTAISGKTAALMASSCRIGALVAGHSPDLIDTLTRYGHKFGMMFQIVDDVLDVVASEDELGKPAGNDMAEGVYTLPVIRALATGDPDAELRALLGSPLDRPEADKARTMVRNADGAVAYAVEVARGYAEEAVATLDGLPDGPATAALADLPSSYLQRIT
jgi:heptaprenyl diphosphate synthase